MSMWLVLGKKKLSRGTLLLWEEWIGLCWTDLGIKAISRFSSICLCCYGLLGRNKQRKAQPTSHKHNDDDEHMDRSGPCPYRLPQLRDANTTSYSLDLNTNTPAPHTHTQMPILLHIVWTWTPTPTPTLTHTQCTSDVADDWRGGHTVNLSRNHQPYTNIR